MFTDYDFIDIFFVCVSMIFGIPKLSYRVTYLGVYSVLSMKSELCKNW